MDTKYVISVDALDLSLLPLTYRPRSTISPLWNHDNDLSEFTIHVKNTSPSEQSTIEESTSTQRTKATETTVCHMCKVDVPKQYFKEHKNSLKHNTYTKIANIALQRIKEHINDGCDSDEAEVNKLTYFCSHCTAVVDLNDRKKHENSHSHKNSVFLDKYLSDFLDLYSNLDNNNDSSIDNESSYKNVNENNSFDLKHYIHILKEKYKMSLKFIDEDRLEIEVDGSRVEVPVQNFLGLKTTSDGLECVICKEVFQIRNKVDHIMGAKHMYRVSIPLKDIHCKREIYPLWHHCVLCNIITDNYKLHTSDPVHHSLLQKALKYKQYDSAENSICSGNWAIATSKMNKTAPSTNKDTSQKIYNDSLDTENTFLTSKDSVLSTSKKSFCNHCNVYIVTKNLRKHITTKKHVGNSISKYYYLFKIDMETTYCRVCDIVVKGPDDFKKHVLLSEHVDKYNALLSTNKIRIINNNQLFCQVCDKIVLAKNELYHIKGNDHLQCLESNKSTPDQLPKTSEYHSNVCNVSLPNTGSDIQLHNDGLLHNVNKSKTLLDSLCKETKNYFYDYTMLETHSPDLVNCSVCDILFTKDEEILQKHIESENHMGLYKKMLLDHNLELRSDNIFCNICKVPVGIRSEIMHVKGKRHLKNFQKTREETGVSLVRDAQMEARLNVKPSDVNMSEDEMNMILEHYDISENLKELICKTCKVTVPFTIYNGRGHLGGSKHKQKVMDLETIKFKDIYKSLFPAFMQQYIE